ncbi:MAG: class I SAM-dependent methyltransferase [Coleofasciculaceae cyanobacterium RL_1_1]|nr:class I SAM-dependent methyltransferase [Coleofasciculaceae cyanobacterium RL_1_1]
MIYRNSSPHGVASPLRFACRHGRRLAAIAIAVVMFWMSWGSTSILAAESLNSQRNSSLNLNSSPACTYDQRRFHRNTGIGKFYQGREIAKVIGHQDLFWLERPTREGEERPDLLLNLLDIAPDATIADIGAGTGFLTVRLLDRLNENGRILAIDVEPESQDIIDFIARDRGETRITTILGSPSDPRLPENSIDLAIMLDAYHEFEFPCEMMHNIKAALKPGGRVVLVEYRRENPLIPIKTLHKMTERQAKQEMAAAGFVWLDTREDLPSQHIMIFEQKIDR